MGVAYRTFRDPEKLLEVSLDFTPAALADRTVHHVPLFAKFKQAAIVAKLSATAADHVRAALTQSNQLAALPVRALLPSLILGKLLVLLRDQVRAPVGRDMLVPWALALRARELAALRAPDELALMGAGILMDERAAPWSMAPGGVFHQRVSKPEVQTTHHVLGEEMLDIFWGDSSGNGLAALWGPC